MTTGHTNSIYLGLLLHNHQPVGNFPWVFQQVYEEAYLPMLEALERHPGVRLSLHYTGSLLDWLQEAHPEFIARVVALVQREQIEIVGGGYYEPILPAIPDKDKIGQILHLTERIKADFGVKPSGMWIAERVWEPGLPRLLREAGVAWTILDDIHFKNVGLEDKDLYGYYATEDQSSVLKVYATSKALRYTIPWRSAAETINTLRSLATQDGKRIIVMGDDGEKFGSWPDTYRYCWGTDGRSGWVETFFTALEQSSEWLHTIPLGEYARSYPALGRVYIPTSSYIEMTEWALPPQKSYLFSKVLHRLEHEKNENIVQFLRGGFWRNFLVRYPEVNNQHKKMLRVHEHVYAAGATPETGLIHLWKAQANDTYWHGLFGGVYMAHVRSAIYHHLIKAENAADRVRHGRGHWQAYEFTDFDRDSQDELIIETDQQNLYLDPQHGGTIFEWDMRRSAHNVTSVMTRHLESYHQTLREHEQERRRRAALAAHNIGHASTEEPVSPHETVRTKEAGLDAYLIEDRYRRNSLLDHFLPPGLPLETFSHMRFEEQSDFRDAPYETQVEQDASGITVHMSRDGLVKRAGALGPIAVHLHKTLFLPIGEEKLVVRYSISNQGQSRLQTTFASEWNINLLGGGGNMQAYVSFSIPDGSRMDIGSPSLPGEKVYTENPNESSANALVNHRFDSNGKVAEVSTFHIGNTWLQQDLCFSLSQAATLWRFSIETVTGSEAGFERTHQGSCLTLLWPLILDAGTKWEVEIVCTGSRPI